ncbi:MAG: hypothetical protein ACRCYP_07055 [Alphaproteobacteria bacterium]
MLKKKIFGFMVLGFLTSLPSWAVKCELDLKENGTLTTVDLPFNYLKRQEGENLTLIHQGSYKVYPIQESQQEIAVIGPLNPCIGIAVTDGVKLVTFHKHSTNSLESMKEILKTNLDSKKKNDWVARIFTAQDDLKWTQNKRRLMHGGKTHTGAVNHIREILEHMGVKKKKIQDTLYKLRPDASSPLYYQDGELGRYELAEVCVAVKLSDLVEITGQLKFFSMDPFAEDIFDYKGTCITQEEMFRAPTSLERQQTPAADFKILYDEIPSLALKREGRLDGYVYQNGINQRRMDQDEEEHCLRHFGRLPQQAIDQQKGVGNNGYNTLRFYPL